MEDGIGLIIGLFVGTLLGVLISCGIYSDTYKHIEVIRDRHDIVTEIFVEGHPFCESVKNEK